MISFLSKVATDVLKKNINLKNITFVLPNQRAGVYLKKHLKNKIAKTSFFPEVITFDNLSEQFTGVIKTPSVELLFHFYTVYTQQTPKNKTESFDVFSNWASVVLNDFNEIDAYLVDSDSIFSTLKSVNELNNWNPDTVFTKNYLSFFQNLENYYLHFTKYLVENKKAYQGLLLKEAVSNLQHYIDNSNKHFVFAGFNILKKSESFIIEELLAANKASIYWDIPHGFLDKDNDSGRFLRKYFTEWSYYKNHPFKQESFSNFDSNKIEIIGVAKNVGMLKHASTLIDSQKNLNDSALILADQNILPIALNSIPKSVEKVNITMGSPLKNYPFADLIKGVFELHKTNKNTFYHKSVLRVLQHPLIQKNVTGISNLVESIISQNKVSISHESIKKNSCLSANEHELILNIFKDVTVQPTQSILGIINDLIDYFKEKLEGYEREILYRHHQLNQQLLHLTSTHNYITSISALYKVYSQLLYSENINFIGEPLQGLQVMGFLETQAIDFKHLIITSVNEGILPKGKKSNSFIPFDVRKHYDLPTYQEEEAITNYHFYRLLSRSEKVSLLYNAQVDTFGGGEKSHFLTQLLWKYPDIKQKIINPKVSSDTLALITFEKTPEVIGKLKELAKKGFSPSAFGTYLYNPIEFYNQKVLGIYEVDEIEETVADNTMGTIIHETLENLYKPFVGKVLSEQILESILQKATKQVQIEFENTYQNGQFDQGKNKLIYEVVVNFVKRFIKDEIKAVKNGQTIRIIALELPLSHEVKFDTFDFPIKFKGFVDRIDEVNGVVRIVDYKSGKVESSQLRLDDFSKISDDYKYSKGLQIMLYAYLYSHEQAFDSSKELQAGIISFKNLKSGFLPINFAAPRKKGELAITATHFTEFLIALESLLVEIFDENVPFLESVK